MPSRRLPILLLVAVLGAGMLSACGSRNRPRVLVPNSDFSVNVVEAPADWPDEKRDWHEDPVIAAQQQRVYETYGKPDYFRFLWRRDGGVVRQADLYDLLYTNRRDPADYMREQSLDLEWIYLDQGITYRFTRSGPEQEPLTDALRVITDLGDPEEMKEHVEPDGTEALTYQYYSRGVIYYFRDGEKIREERHAPVSGWNHRR